MLIASPLPSRLDVPGLADAAVRAAGDAAAQLVGAATRSPSPERVAVAYRSERHFRIDGAPASAFAPLSAFFATADGWIRTHANYPHHLATLLRATRLPVDAQPDDLRDLARQRRAADLAEAITREGGLCVAVHPESPSADAALRDATPPVMLSKIGDGENRPLTGTTAAPLRGVRVLDFTRVIAGPVATRTLALLGAEVLRIDPPMTPEITWQHLDTGAGKRSAVLDVSSASGAGRLGDLLRDADVVVLGYRPAGLARLGLSPEMLAATHPGVVIAQLSAWGDEDRRGFDSLVQAACGIALLEGTPDAPGALPAQALDHSAGYLLAAGVLRALDRRQREGGTWLARTSLRRIAAELLGRPRHTETPPLAEFDAAPHLSHFTVDGHEIVTPSPAITYEGAPTAFQAPRAWGQDEPRWLTA